MNCTLTSTNSAKVTYSYDPVISNQCNIWLIKYTVGHVSTLLTPRILEPYTSNNHNIIEH